jgi:uncharacterized membrane protein
MATKKSPPRLLPLPVRFARLHVKLLIAVVVGVAVFLAAPHSLKPLTRALVGWDIAVAFYLCLTWAGMQRADVDHIRRRAAEQDEGAIALLLLSVAATIASVVAIVFELGASKHAPDGQAVLNVLLAIATILLSWGFMHTIFSLHYAHEYYGEGRDKKIGGLKFPDDGAPDYWDFLYFSLVIGMTSQVSDVAITTKTIRRMAALHGVLSFFFNVTVLALTVNIVSNLIP